MSDYLKDEMFEEILDLDDGEDTSEPCEETLVEPDRATQRRRVPDRQPGVVLKRRQQNSRTQKRASVLEDEEEEQDPLTILITFSIMVIIAAIICGVLWFATHRNTGEAVQGTNISKQEQKGDDKERPVSKDELNKDIQDAQQDLPVSEDSNVFITSDNKSIEFMQCDYMVTPKAYVNLRMEPSTTQGDITVKCQVENGEQLHCIGYNNEYGWSKVEYNGETLFVVSSYVVEVK